MKRTRVAGLVSALWITASCADALVPTEVSAQAPVRSFKLAFYNIQSGKGKLPLAGNASPFSDTANCTDPAKPMNAWGKGIVQAELIARVANDPSVVALGLAEAWACANPAAVRAVLQWPAVSGERNGLALVARFGFTGTEEWVQLDTSLNQNPADTVWVLRRSVCLDAACSASIPVFTAHWYPFTTVMADSYTEAAIQARQTLDMMARLPLGQRHVLIGDLNVFEGNQHICEQDPHNGPGETLRSAGYLDGWPSMYGSADGSTGMWNYHGCGTPEGNLWKRIDYAWSKSIAPIGFSRFGMVTPGQAAPSDHAGIIAEYAWPTAAQVGAPPTVWIDTPNANATVSNTVRVGVTATDDEGIGRVEMILDGRTVAVQTAAPFAFDWNSSAGPSGLHTLEAAATDRSGNRTISAKRTVTVQPPIAPLDETVLYAAAATRIVGAWAIVDDSSAAGGKLLRNANGGAPALAPAATPASYFEMSFDAAAGKPYRIWMRGRAANDSPLNDSVSIQFDHSADASGTAVSRIGSTRAATINIEDCDGCGLLGWGWQDTGVPRDVLGPAIYFTTAGAQRLRVQVREDGIDVDQIVISAVRYRYTPPGSITGDRTILPPSPPDAPPPPIGPPGANDEIVLHVRNALNITCNWAPVPDTTAAGGVRLQSQDRGAAKVAVAAAAPADAFELTFDADAGRAYRLWMRGRAAADSYSNDSVYVQFDGSVDGAGQAVNRIGTASGVGVVVEDCSACGLHGWGWADNGYGTIGAPISFGRTGPQRLRVQVREDGVAVDQIVLSAVRFKTTAPGTTRDDTTILPATGSVSPEIVMYAGSAENVHGNWVATADASAAAGIRLQSADLAQPKVTVPLSAPQDSFELTFQADAGKAYSLWVRGRAAADSYSNDSMYLQFDGSVDASGRPVNRIGTTSAVPVIVEDCSGCGLLGWGWADDGYGQPATPVYFARSGLQRVRVQGREDGVAIDQIVLSAARYKTIAPGATKNDSTIVPR